MKKQLSMNIYKGTHGGRRPNSGRKRIHSLGVAHRARPKITRHTPFHINFKYRAFIRTEKVLKILENALENARNFDFTITHFSIQTNHIHLIGETNSTQNLIRGMRSLTATMVKRIGKGSIQLERYHLHVLKTPQEAQYAIRYVLTNDLKHKTKQLTKFTQRISPGTSWLLQTQFKK